MKPHLFSTLLVLLVLFLGLSHAHPNAVGERILPRAGEDTDPPTTVLRGERSRTPQQVKDAGGFYSRGLQQRRDGIKLTPKQIELGSSLFEHGKGNTATYTQYVSTTTKPDIAVRFSMADKDKTGYIYVIAADSKAVDMEKSLEKFMKIVHTGQGEQSFVGAIPWEQVKGWYDVGPENAIKVMDSIQAGQVQEGVKYTKNPEYNEAKYRGTTGAALQPQLAGFPDNILDKPYSQKQWKPFKGQKASENLANYFWNIICATDTTCYKHFQPRAAEQAIATVVDAKPKPDPIPDKVKSKIISGEDAVRIQVKGASKSRTLFRGDTRPPDIIFKEGFQARGKNLDLSLWLGGSSEGGYVSTSRSFKVASSKNYALGGAREEALAISEGRTPAVEGYAYQIDPEGLKGIWMMSAGRPNDPNLEFAVIGEVPAENIRFAYKAIRNPDGTVKVSKKPFMENKDSKRAAFSWLSCLQGQSRLRRQEKECTNWEEEGISDVSASEKVGSQEGGPSKMDKPIGEQPGKPTDETPATLHNQYEAPTTFEPADDGEIMAIAKQKSKESFDNLLQEFDYGDVVKQDQLYNVLNARPELSTPRSERIAGFTAKVGEGALTIAGLALYGKAVADVFSSDVSVLDKAAVVTSILPGIGCAVQFADSVAQGHVDAVHTALCFTEDALAVSGFWEIALAMQIGEEIGNWIEAGNERDKLWDMELLARKCPEGWLHNVQRLIKHLKSDEFIANATTQFSTYQILALYQASQLTGDLHAAHQLLSANATVPNLQLNQSADLNISKHVQPELKRQICATIAESRYQLQMKLESKALNHTAKLAREFRDQFLDDWFKAATTPTPIFGIKLPDWPENTRRLREKIDKARNEPLPLYEDEIKQAIAEVIERVKTPAPCQCYQGKKGRKCEFGDCQRPKPQNHPKDAGGRIYVTSVPSMEWAKGAGLGKGCQALFKTCQVAGSTSGTGRPLWCMLGE